MKLRTVTYAATPPEAIEWLWRHRIARRKVTALIADGGVGKSSVTCRLAAGVTRGDLDGAQGPGRVLLINMEDGDGDTTRPRLEAQGANLALVEHLDHTSGEMLILPGDIERLREQVLDARYELIVLDPIAACLSPRISFSLDSSIRSAIMPLVRLAEASGAAVLLVHHLNGRVNASAYRRLLGGAALANIVRAVYALGIHPDDRGAPDGRRVFSWVKGNLAGIDKSSIECTLDRGRFEFGRIIPITADELLCERRSASRSGSGRTAPRRDDAVSFLVDALADGARVPSTDLEARAAARGISRTTLDRARDVVGVRSERDGRGWVTRLDSRTSRAESPRSGAPLLSLVPDAPHPPAHGGPPAPPDDASIRFSLLELDLETGAPGEVLGKPRKTDELAQRTPLAPTTPSEAQDYRDPSADLEDL